MFKDILQEMLEAELGCAKVDKKNKRTDNKRNDCSYKTVKIQFGEIAIKVLKEKNGNFELINDFKSIYKAVNK